MDTLTKEVHMSLTEAINSYHDLLTDDLAGESQFQLENQQRLRGLFFGQRPLCNVLRPRFLTQGQYHFLQKRVHLLMHAFDKIYSVAIEDAGFRAQFGLLDYSDYAVVPAPSTLSKPAAAASPTATPKQTTPHC